MRLHEQAREDQTLTKTQWTDLKSVVVDRR